MSMYRQYLDINSVSRFIIISPKIDEIRSFLSQRDGADNLLYPFNFILLKDEQVLHPEIVSGNSEGWLKQQLIKLLASQHCDTEYYISTDDDIFLKRPLSYDDLFHTTKYNVKKVRFKSEKYKDWEKRITVP